MSEVEPSEPPASRGKCRCRSGILLLCSLLLVLTPSVSEARPPRAEPSEAPLALDADIARFLARKVPVRLEPEARLQSLLDAVFAKDGLGISYGNQRTKTAIETFRTRSGNCLSFTLLFVAMARHVGLHAYFQEVSEVTSWDRRGELVVVHQHMFAEVEILNGHIQVDFLPGAEKRYRQVRRIDDSRALAHFYNNLGVDQLASGDLDAAEGLFERSLEAASDFTPALANLGVTLRRLERFEEAEASFRRALDIDPDASTVLTNLASFYLAVGRAEEAQPLLEQAEGHLRRNPYHHYRRGMVALQQGDPESATRHLQQAIRRLETDPEIFLALAEAFEASGDSESASQARRRAEALRAASVP